MTDRVAVVRGECVELIRNKLELHVSGLGLEVFDHTLRNFTRRELVDIEKGVVDERRRVQIEAEREAQRIWNRVDKASIAHIEKPRPAHYGPGSQRSL